MDKSCKIFNDLYKFFAIEHMFYQVYLNEIATIARS